MDNFFNHLSPEFLPMLGPQPCYVALGRALILIYKITSSGIQTQELTVCLYLNLKHGELDHSSTRAGKWTIYSELNNEAGNKI